MSIPEARDADCSRVIRNERLGLHKEVQAIEYRLKDQQGVSMGDCIADIA